MGIEVLLAKKFLSTVFDRAVVFRVLFSHVIVYFEAKDISTLGIEFTQHQSVCSPH